MYGQEILQFMYIIIIIDQTVLVTLINDMRTQFEQKRFHSPENLEGIWQLLYPEHFINVLLIHHLKRREEKEILGVARIMKSGLMYESTNDPKKSHKISDIFKPFQSEDGSATDPKLILINGAPGMGKTTLCKEIAYQWANKKLLTDTKVVFLLFLRDPAVHKIQDLKDFIHYFYKFNPSFLDLSKQCADILTTRDNSDITILMDGYDEFNDKDNNSLIKNIIERDILPQCRIVITSRPIASENLQKFADVRVEVLGFTPQSRREYIEKELKEYPEKIESLLHYLSNHNDINRVCYIPIMMTIMVCTFKEIEELPTNQSELYERFITLAISRCVQKLDKTNILSLNRLPKKYQEYLHQLSEFAFKTIEDNKIVFSDMDIEKLSPTLASSSKEYQGLGLFRATEHLSIKRMENCIWYNFLHLSIHEFLAAYYLNTLEPCEQFKILKRTLFIKRYINVWSLFIGLQHDVTYDFHHFLTYSYIQEASDTVKDHVMSLLQTIHLLNFSEIKSFKLKSIKGIFQFFCSKNNMLTDRFLTNVTYDIITKFDTTTLLQFNRWPTNLFASLCNTDNSDQLIEIYFSDKNTKFDTYYQLIEALKENQNLSVMLLSSNTLVGYRSNHLQLTNALNINKSLERITLRYCLINKDIANTMSSYLRNSHCLRKLSITNSKLSNNPTFLIVILQTLKESCKLKVLDFQSTSLTVKETEELANVIKKNPGLEELYLSNSGLKTSAAVILKALKEKSVLTKLNLNKNLMTEEAADNFKENSRLNILNLNDNIMTEEAAEDLADVINNNTHLKQLCIANNKLGVSAAVILQALTRTSNLEVLDLDGSNLTGEVVEHLVSVIKNNSCLKQLYLSSNDFKSSVSAILRALKENSRLNVLNLNDNVMTEEAAEDLADVIKNNTHLKQLCIENNKLGVSAAVILQALTRTSNLEVLDLDGSNLTGEVVEHLVSVIKNNSCLKQLYLSSNDFKSSVSAILRALKENSRLNVLNLNDNVMTEEAAEDLADVIKNNTHLKQLCIENNKLGVSAAVILQALTRTSNLEVLNLNGSNLTGEVVEHLVSVIKNNSCLKQLYLSSNGFKFSVSAILKALKENSRLNVLKLNDNVMTEEAAEDLADVIKNNTYLKQLCIANNKLGVSAAVTLQALTRTSNLEVLDLDGSNLTGEVVEHLVSVIKNNSRLKELYLSSNDFKSSVSAILRALKENSRLNVFNLNDNVMTEEAAEDLADVIKNNTHLKQLCIENNKLGVSAAVILQALTRTSNLEVLNLNGSNLTGEVVEHLVSVIKNNSCLKQLYLSSNDFKSSVSAILKALKENSRLNVLNLNDNVMTEEAAEDLADVIKNNTHLKQLCIENNKLGVSAAVILQALTRTSNLEVLNLNGSNLTGEVVEHLVSVIKNNSCLKQLYLSSNDFKSSVSAILRALKENSRLNVLNLNDNVMTEEAAEDLADVIKNNTYLKQLCIENNKLGVSAAVILQALTRTSNHEVLNLNGSNLTGEVVEHLVSVIKNNSCLKQLYLSSNDFKSSVSAILKALKENSRLNVLNLNDNVMTEEAAEDLADVIKNNTHLKQLCIENNKLGVSAAVILQALTRTSNLEVLNLNGSNLTGEVVEHLVSVIKNNSCLKQLYLSSNDFKSSVSAILRALKENSRLNVLNLNDNVMTEEAAEDLADVIKNNTYLKQLCIENNKLGVSAAVILQALTRTSNHEVLNLNGSNLTGEVVEHLVSVIKNNSCLKQLYLSSNDFKFSVSAILKALKENSRLNVLKLNDNVMTEEAAEDLADVIKNNTYLKQLCIANNKLGVSAAVTLQALTRTSNLEVLDLDGSNLTGEVVEHLVSVIKNNSRLKQLYLSSNDFKSSVSAILRALKENSRLNVLNLNDNVMTEEAAEDLADVIKNNTHLKQLCIENNKLGVSAAVILQALTRTSNLEVLDLDGSNLTGEVVEHLVSVIKNNSRLKQLYLSSNDFKSSVSAILRALKENSRLNVLNLNDNVMTEEAAEDLADVIKNNTHLKQLCIENNKLGVSAAVILQALTRTSNLEVLDLDGSNLTGEVVEHLVSVIKNNSRLKQLYLSSNDFKSSVSVILRALKENSRLNILHLNDNVMTEEAAEDLADIIKNSTHLKQLCIANNKLGVSAAVILQALTRTSNLEVLNLNGSNLTGEVVEHLVSVIKNNSRLKQLYLSSNDFKSSVSAILRALKENSRLNVLNLNDNVMTEEAAEDLADVIKNNTHLKQLCIENNKLGVSAAVILQALTRTSNLEVLDLDGSNLTGEVVEHLVSVIKNNSRLKQLYLSSNDFKSSVSVILRALKENSRLNILHLNDNVMTEEAAEDLADVIKNSTHLKQLCIANNKLGVSAAVILQALTRTSNLEVLNLNGSNLTGEVVEHLVSVIKNNSRLKQLYLSSNDFKSSVSAILRALKENSRLNVLNLNDNVMTEEAAEDLADVIKNNTHLKQLCIENNKLGVSAAVILQALTRTSNLEVLDLDGSNLTGEVVEHLVSVIKNNSRLKQLYLSSNDFKSSVSVILRALKENSRLNILHLNDNVMTEEAAEDLADVIKNSTHLKQLCIANNKLGVSAAVILQALTRTSNLEVLNLNGSNLTGEVVEHLVSVIKNNSCLKQLYLSYNDFKSSVSAILEALKENSRLNILHLNGNLMTEEAAEDLADVIKSNTHLKQISIANNKLGVSAAVILQALTRTSNLEVLDLNGSNLTGEVVEHLVSVIKKNSRLKQLYLSSNDFKSSVSVILRALKENSRLNILHLNDNVMTEEAAEDLADVIKNSTHLKQLCIANNKLGVSASVILQALTRTSNLEVLNLNGSNLTGEVVEHLVSVIKNNSCLKQLYLSYNDFKSSVSAILEALKENSRLNILHLNGNLMTEEAAEDLADVIKSNTHLKQISIANNKLGVSAAVILQALTKSSKLKVLNLNGSNLTEQLVGDLIKVTRNNSDLEELYLSNNDLRSSVFVILQALVENSELKVLDLNSNNITGVVVGDLASAIKFSSNLQRLSLANNNLQSSSVMILQGLKELCKLEVLNLDNNNMTGLVSKDLASVIKNNPGLEKLCLSLNDLRSSAVVILQALREHCKLKILSLCANNMTGQLAGYLASVLDNHPNLKDLRIRNNMLGSSVAKVLQALTKTSKLKTLNLISINLTGQVSQDLANVIRINPGLEYLFLSDTNLKSSAVVILQALKLNSQLNKLYLHNFLTESVIVELVSIIKYNPLITELWLGNNLLQSGLIDIAKICNNLTNLHALELSCNNINSMEVLKLVSIIVKLNSLHVLVLGCLIFDVKERFYYHLCNIIKQKCLFQRTGIDNELLKGICLEIWRLQFAERIKLNHYLRDFFPKDMINVQMISFYTEKFSSNALSIVEQSEKKLSQLDATNIIISLSVIIKPLKVLDLEYSNIRKEAAVELATALNCNNVLEQLWLRGNVLGAVGAAVILTSLQNMTTLRVLDLSYNNISSRSANGIAAVINSNHFLEQLWLDGNMLMTTGVVIIARALKKHSNLTLLSLSNNEITEDAAEEISAIVNSNNLLEGLLLSNNQLQFMHLSEITKSHGGIQFLHILELSNNSINATAADKLAVTLSSCVCLKELYLGNNNLGTTGVVKIFQAVKNIPILQVLSLNKNNITTEAASEICDVINTNTNLDILLLGGNNLQTSGVLQIAEAVKNNNPTMQLLSLSDNNVDEQVKEDIKVMLCDQCDLELFI